MDEKDKDANEQYKDYRNSGIAFSVTLSSLAAALIIWAQSFLDQMKGVLNYWKIIIILQILFLSLSILSSLCIQFFNYQGYKCQARSLFGQSAQQEANKWFSKEDCSVCVSIILFLIGVVFTSASFILSL